MGAINTSVSENNINFPPGLSKAKTGRWKQSNLRLFAPRVGIILDILIYGDLDTIGAVGAHRQDSGAFRLTAVHTTSILGTNIPLAALSSFADLGQVECVVVIGAHNAM